MTEKPQAKPVDIGYLPDKLCKTAKFCNWRYEWDADREAWTKVPKDPRTGRNTRIGQPDTYTDLDTVVNAESNYDGIGVGVFGNLAGIDVDHCIDEDGNLADYAQDIVDTMDAYTEKSPSGTGIRIFFTVPDNFDYDQKEFFVINSRGYAGNIEVHVAGKTRRFLTVTGDALTEGKELEERGDQLHVVLDKYMRRPAKTKAKDTTSQHVDASDEELYNIMDQDERFRALWAGDISDYQSQSEADLALCNILAFYTGRDPDRMDKFFRLSGLYRDKWERDDYRDRTIRKAIDDCVDVYKQSKQEKPGPLPRVSVAKYLTTGGMEADLDYFRKYQDRKTGFYTLDQHLTLYPGLAAIGGAASLGKSTFCVNLADNLVEAGETVLFFTLEQTPVEIVTKSLSRRLAKEDPTTHLNNVKIKNGCTDDRLDKVKQDYADTVAERFYIIPCDFQTTAAQIRDTVEAFITDRGVRPIVFIDYLQLVSPPENFRGDQRAAIDHNIKLFKTMQLANELLVVLVSNFNRSGYDTPVSYEDFKESSLIEFTCDYVWGMQLAVLSDRDFYYTTGTRGGKQKTTEIERDDMIADAMRQYPKRIQFVSLKNRNGRQRFRCDFDYYPDFDYFRDGNFSVDPFNDVPPCPQMDDLDFD